MQSNGRKALDAPKQDSENTKYMKRNANKFWTNAGLLFFNQTYQFTLLSRQLSMNSLPVLQPRRENPYVTQPNANSNGVTVYCFTFDCVDHNKLDNSQRDGNTRPQYLPPEKPVCRSRSQQLELDMEQQTAFKTGKGIREVCILSLYLFNLNAEYIIWNAGLDEAQAGIKITGRNISNLRYADDTTLMV